MLLSPYGTAISSFRVYNAVFTHFNQRVIDAESEFYAILDLSSSILRPNPTLDISPTLQ